MATIIDLIGSFVIIGAVMLTIFALTTNLNQASYNKSFSTTTQTNATTLARVLDYDIVKIGYHTSKPAMIIAKTDSMSFKADLLDDGNVKTVQYFLGSTSGMSNTKNPRDKVFYRIEGGKTIAMGLGVTGIQFSYYNNDGFATAALDSIKSIRVKITIESATPVDTSYSVISWQKRFYPKNL